MNSTSPSRRERIQPVLKNSRTIRTIIGYTIRLGRAEMSSVMLRSAAAKPSAPNILKISLPIRLPMDRPSCPRIAAIIEVAISGAEVPAAIMVAPMIHSDMPKIRAKFTEEKMRKWEPMRRKPSPKTRKKRSFF